MGVPDGVPARQQNQSRPGTFGAGEQRISISVPTGGGQHGLLGVEEGLEHQERTPLAQYAGVIGRPPRAQGGGQVREIGIARRILWVTLRVKDLLGGNRRVGVGLIDAGPARLQIQPAGESDALLDWESEDPHQT